MGRKNKSSSEGSRINRSRESDLFPSDEILKGVTYFAITTGSDDGKNWWSGTQTYWTGYADDEHRIDLRKIRPVYPEKMAQIWKDFRQPFCVVNDDTGYVRWMLSGGHALVTKAQTRKHLPGEMKPKECVMEGRIGFTSVKLLPKAAFQKAPTPKIRMKVLKRDQYRCMICGQQPADDVNIQLHAHHIRPFSERGVTTEKNLITLCHTCHSALEPHYEYSLYDLLDRKYDGSGSDFKKRELKKYLNSVKNYYCMIRTILDPFDKIEE